MVVIPVVILILFLGIEQGLRNWAPAAWFGTPTINNRDYEFQPVSASGNPLKNLPEFGSLKVKLSPTSGYELVPNQTNSLWQINAAGFRSASPTPTSKSAGQIRIFLLGNSTAFGTLATNNQATIASSLEQLLRQRLQSQVSQPQKFQPRVLPYFADQVEQILQLPPQMRNADYQVITAAVPGYTTTNELSLLAHRVSEFKPDCIIFLHGYEDLRSPSQSPMREIINLEQFINQQSQQEQKNNEQHLQNWFNQLYIVRLWQNFTNPQAQPPLKGYYQVFKAEQLAIAPTEIQARVTNYTTNLRKFTNIMGQIPLVIALQPEITGKSNPTATEIAILKNLGSEYQNRIKTAYKTLGAASPDNRGRVRFINLYNGLGNHSEALFLDPIHLTPSGNQIVAQSLFNVLEDIFKIDPQPASAP